MANLRGNKIVFAATFLSKIAFGILFTIACFFIQEDVEHKDIEGIIDICGGEDWYFLGKRLYDAETSKWVGYVAWDEKVVHCMHNIRGGLFIGGAVCLFLSILLELKARKKCNGKLKLFMVSLQTLGSLLIVGAAVSEIDIMKRMKSTTAKIFKADDYEALFIIDYPEISRTMWIVGFVLLLLGQLHTLFENRHSGVQVLSTHTIAALGSILFLVVGILRSANGGSSWKSYHSGEFVDQGFHSYNQIITDIFAVMLSGAVFSIAHAMMFFFFLYDEAILIYEEKELSNEELMEEGQNPNSSLDINQEDKDEVRKA